MSVITIILFLIYTYGLGFAASYKLQTKDALERHTMRIGIGLGVFVVLTVILNLLHIPVDWKIITLLSLAAPAVAIIKSKQLPKIKPKLTKSSIYFIIVAIIFVFTLSMYVKGAFIYPYLENDDPWSHATGVKYVAEEKNFRDDTNTIRYIAPYPPGYDAWLGVLHQTSSSLMWTMKFFNALIISLGIFFFYFFAKSFTKNKDKALFATAVLAMVPSYLSHFIWAHALITTIFIVALYALTRIKENKNWMYVLAILIAAAAFTQPSQSVKYAIMFSIYLVITSLYEKKINWPVLKGMIYGYALSLLWWAKNLSSVAKNKAFVENLEAAQTSNLWSTITTRFPPHGGTATRAYSFDDFFYAQHQNMINNPIGIGVAISVISIISIIFILATFKNMSKERKTSATILVLWLIFTFLGVNSMTFNLPVGLFAFRFWMLLALPLSLVAGEGISYIAKFLKQLKIPQIITIAVLIFLVFTTSGQQKYSVNTAIWPPGQGWTSMEEVAAYNWLTSLPDNTKVFAYSDDEQTIGYDMYSCAWCPEVQNFRKDLINKTPEEVHQWAKQQGYEYLMIDGQSFRKFSKIHGENATNIAINSHIQKFFEMPTVQAAHQTQGAIIFRI